MQQKKEGELVSLDWKKVGKDVDKKDYRGKQSSGNRRQV